MKKIISSSVAYAIISMVFAGCKQDQAIESSAKIAYELPNVTSHSKQRSVALSQGEIDAIINGEHTLHWGYYRDSQKRRWYISLVDDDPDLKGYVLSLMNIEANTAGWGVVSETAANMDASTDKIAIGAIPDKTTDIYYDLALQKEKVDSRIISDTSWIRNTSVDIEWYFFTIPNSNKWFIVKPGHKTIYMFDSNGKGEYDWTTTLEVPTPVMFMDNGVKKLKFESHVFDLNSPENEMLNFPKEGCSFADVGKLTKEYPYVTALCQSNIDIGIQESHYVNFEPDRSATWGELLKIVNYSQDYEKVLKQCGFSPASTFECQMKYVESIESISSMSETDLITISNAVVYAMSRIYNQSFSEESALAHLKMRGVLDANIDIHQNLTRGEMARIILNIAGLYNKEKEPENLKKTVRSISAALPSLPLGVNPPDDVTPLVATEVPTAYADGISTNILELIANSCWDDPIYYLLASPTTPCDSIPSFGEGIQSEILMPNSSIAQPATVAVSEESIDFPTAVVSTAKSSVGKVAPYVDSNNTHDLLFVTNAIGLPNVYTSNTEFVEQYDDKSINLPNAKNGDVIVYKPEASSDGQPHVAIKVSETTEISLPNVSGVQETTTVSNLVDKIIPLSAFDLPQVSSFNKQELFGEVPLISTTGNVSGILGRGEADTMKFVAQQGQNVTFKLNNSNYDTPISVSIYQRFYEHFNIEPLLQNRFLHSGDTVKVNIEATAEYKIVIMQQGGEEYQKDEYSYEFSLLCDSGACSQWGDKDSPTIPNKLVMGQATSSSIDYSGDSDYYQFDNPSNGLVKIRAKSRILNGKLIDIDDNTLSQYNNMGFILYRIQDAELISLALSDESMYLDKGKYLLVIGQSDPSLNHEPYALKVWK